MNNPIHKLKNLLTSKIESESYYSVNAIARHYPNFIKIYEPYKLGKKLFAGLEAYGQIAKITKSYHERTEEMKIVRYVELDQ